MRLVFHPDAASFLAAAGAFLAEREGLHQLPLMVARQCVADPLRYPGPNLFAVLEDGGLPAGIALMTPPHGVLYYAPEEAAERAAADIDTAGWAPPGVQGPLGASDAFARAWCGRQGLRARPGRDMRAFELTEVTPAPPAPGRMRPARPGEADLVAGWHLEFYRETGTARSSLPPDEMGRRSVREGRAFLWEDGVPVAQAVVSGSTPTAARVGGVYTPADRRRRGYATALVAALSRRLLDEGNRACQLFTDLANPTSNSIYAKIGYRPLADMREIEFEAPTRSAGTGEAPR